MSGARNISDAHVGDGRGLSRRELLRIGGTGAVLLGAGGLAGPAFAGAAHRSAGKTGGTLRVGIGGGGPTDSFDAALVNGPSSTTRAQIFYETLTWLDGHLSVKNWLCESCTPNATASSWTVRLKQGLEFHNGKSVTADDVIYSIKRLLDPKTGAVAAAQLGQVDMTRTKKLDAHTVRFALKAPVSFFDQILSDIVYIIPVGYDPKKPVSTGPWKFVSFTPGQQTVLVPFENYWGVKAKVDKLIIVELADDSARVNALISGQVDVINQVPFQQVPVLKSNANVTTVVSQTAAWNPITMRVDTAPFDDVRVRQAIRLCMDRKQAVSTALFGQGVPASDYFGRFDATSTASLVREPDIAMAKSLLKAAGKSNLTVELVTSPIAAGITEACEVLAQNAKAAGITINLRKVDPGTYFAQYGKWPFAIDYWVGLPFLVTSSLADGPSANVVNVTHFKDPAFDKLFDQASKTIGEKQRAPIVHEMQKIQYDRGGYLIWSFQNTVDAYSKKVTGYNALDETGWGLGRCQLNLLSLA